MKKGSVITAIAVVLAAVLAAAFAVLLAFSLWTRFQPKPTAYPDTVWVSEDGAFVLTVGKYNEDTYQCDAELSYTAPDGSVTVYTVSDGVQSVIGVLRGDGTADSWLRVKCNADSFTARINRTAEMEYSGEYGKGEKVKFGREGE